VWHLIFEHRSEAAGEKQQIKVPLGVLNIYEIVFAISHKSSCNFTLGCSLACARGSRKAESSASRKVFLSLSRQLNIMLIWLQTGQY
jgi:hypothetical protein